MNLFISFRRALWHPQRGLIEVLRERAAARNKRREQSIDAAYESGYLLGFAQGRAVEIKRQRREREVERRETEIERRWREIERECEREAA